MDTCSVSAACDGAGPIGRGLHPALPSAPQPELPSPPSAKIAPTLSGPQNAPSLPQRPARPRGGRQARFLHAYARWGSISAGVRAAGISWPTAHRWIGTDTGFQRRFEQARARFEDRIRQRMLRRADHDPVMLRLIAKRELGASSVQQPERSPPHDGTPGESLYDIIMADKAHPLHEQFVNWVQYLRAFPEAIHDYAHLSNAPPVARHVARQLLREKSAGRGTRPRT